MDQATAQKARMFHRRPSLSDTEIPRRPPRVPHQSPSQSGGLRDIYLGIGTGCRRVNGGSDKLHMSAKVGPLLLEQHDYGNFPHRKILLVAQVFVSRYKNIKAGGFGGALSKSLF